MAPQLRSIYTCWLMCCPTTEIQTRHQISPQFLLISNKSIFMSFLYCFSPKYYCKMKLMPILTFVNKDFAQNYNKLLLKVVKQHQQSIIPLPKNYAFIRKNHKNSINCKIYHLYFNFIERKSKMTTISIKYSSFNCSFA